MTEQALQDPNTTTTSSSGEEAASQATPSSTSTPRTNHHMFPQYLMKLLNDQVAPDALWWMSDGQAFCLDPTKITSQVLDAHFQKTKYSSFIRRLHNEGFRRQTRKYKKMDGVSLREGTVVLSHDLFQRDHPELLKGFYTNATNNKTNTEPTTTMKEASKSRAAMMAAAAAAAAASTASTNTTGLALVEEAKARMEARNKQAWMTSMAAFNTKGGNTTSSAAAATTANNPFAAATSGGMDALAAATRNRFGVGAVGAGMTTTTPNWGLMEGAGAGSLQAQLNLEELRQVRMQRELLAQEQLQQGSSSFLGGELGGLRQSSLFNSYPTTIPTAGGGLRGMAAGDSSMGMSPYSSFPTGGGRMMNHLNNHEPFSRSSSIESAKQKQQQRQLDLMLQQQLLASQGGGAYGSGFAPGVGGGLGLGHDQPAGGRMQAQMSQLHQLELETRRARLQLEQQQQQQQQQHQDLQQKQSAADALRRFTNNASPH